MNKEVLILMHVPTEDAGTIINFLNSKQIPHRSRRLYIDEPLPASLDAVRALVIMGGPMNVYEEEKYPFLEKENALIQKALKAEIPCLGICLGAQLMAKALGAAVMKAQAAEVGWCDLTLKGEALRDNLFSFLERGKKLRVLQWHEDTFDLPQGAVLLASSQIVPHQAFRYGQNAYGFQFHLEVNRPMLEQWFKGRDELNEILRTYDSYRAELDQIAYKIYEEFFNLETTRFSSF